MPRILGHERRKKKRIDALAKELAGLWDCACTIEGYPIKYAFAETSDDNVAAKMFYEARNELKRLLED